MAKRKRRKQGYSIEPRGSDFAVDEWTDGYEIVHKATGKRHWMSDGVDLFETKSGRSLFPGTAAFDRAMASMLIHDQENLYEAYFPELFSSDDLVPQAKTTKTWRGVRAIRQDDLRGPHILPEEQGQIVYDEWYAHPDGPVAVRVDRSMPVGRQAGAARQYDWSVRDEFEPWNGITGAIGRGRRVVLA